MDWVLHKQRLDELGNLNPKLTGLDLEDLRSVWVETGLCIVQSGNERALIKMLEDRLEQKGNEVAKGLIEEARQTSEEKNPLKSALTAFYLKTEPGADNAVEFYHKSFGEFLSAERFVESLATWTLRTGTRRRTYAINDAELDRQVYDLLGYGNLTPEIVEYVIALLKKSEELDWVALFERLKDFYLRWSNGEFIEVQETDALMLPLHKARQLQKDGVRLGQRQVDIYTGLNVLVLLLELHRYGQSQEALRENLVFRPCGDPDEEEEFDATRLLRIIGYSECLGVLAFSQELGAFLIGVYLQGAHLNGAHLQRACFNGADLQGTHLQRVHLQRAHLNDADLQGASLQGASLQRANLQGVNFSGVTLNAVKWDIRTRWANATGLHEARGIPETLIQDPKFAAAVALSRGYSRVRQGEVEAALSDYREAQKLDPQLEISTKLWVSV